VMVSLVVNRETGKLQKLGMDSIGFLLAKDADGLFEQAEAILTESINNLEEEDPDNWTKTKRRIERKLGKLFHKKLQRNPRIVIIIHEL